MVPAIESDAGPGDEHGAARDEQEMPGHAGGEGRVPGPGEAGGPEQVDHQGHGAADGPDLSRPERDGGDDEKVQQDDVFGAEAASHRPFKRRHGRGD